MSFSINNQSSCEKKYGEIVLNNLLISVKIEEWCREFLREISERKAILRLSDPQ
jgi:hypothetical protein